MGYKLTRIAPTPSGYLHLGNLFSFALTAALARRSGAAILLRIDDLDRERVQREYVEDIFETLWFMGIPWDRGPRDVDEFERTYSQVHRLPLYSSALSLLRDRAAVFGCSCSRAEVLRASRDGGYPGTCGGRGISLDASEVRWRVRTMDVAGVDVGSGTNGASGTGGEEPKATELAAGPEVLRVKTYPEGVIETQLPAEMRDFVVRKKDGFPAYQLSSVIDDLHYGVDLVVRGRDLWASTLAQMYLSYPLDAAAFREIRFYHHPLLITGAGEKLSKSAGDTSIRYLRGQGLSAAEIYAMIAREVVRGVSGGDTAGAASSETTGADPLRAADDDGLQETSVNVQSRKAEEVRDWEGLGELVLG